MRRLSNVFSFVSEIDLLKLIYEVFLSNLSLIARQDEPVLQQLFFVCQFIISTAFGHCDYSGYTQCDKYS